MAVKGRVTIAWLDPGTVTSDFAVAIADLCRLRTNKISGRIVVRSGGAICRGRNQAVDQFLSTKDDWLLFVDSDMAFDNAAFDIVCDAAHADRAPVVGGLCFGQDGNVGPFAGLVPTVFDADGNGGYLPRWDYAAGQLLECDATGCAFLLIHRSVLEKVRTDVGLGRWSWFAEHPAVGVDGWVGEDLTFCERVKASGFPVHVHTGARIGHVKGVNYTLTEDMYRILQGSKR